MDPQITFYQKRLNLQHATFKRIDHEDAMVAVVYKVTPQKGQPLILKISDRPIHYMREVYFLKFFADLIPVPRIIDLIEPEKEIHGAILMECLEGELLKSDDLMEPMAYELGALLARIHLTREADYGDVISPDDLSQNPATYFNMKFEEGLAECSHHIPPALLEKCRQYLDEHSDLFSRVDGPCIVHRDFRPGNLIVKHGKLQGIIDWAGARASFAEEDFCSLEHGEWPNHPKSRSSFLEGYASIRPVPDYQVIMPLLRLSKAIATVGFTLKRGTWSHKNKKIYQFNRQFLENFF